MGKYAEKIKKLFRQKDEKVKRMNELVDAPVREERGYSEDERKEITSLREGIADLNEQIENLRALEKEEGNISGNDPEPDTRNLDGQNPAGNEKKTKYRTLGHFVRDIYRFGRNMDVSENFRNYREALEPQLRSMNISDGTSLGFMIMDMFENGTLELRGPGGSIRQRCRVIPAGEYPDQKFKKRVRQQGENGADYGVFFNYVGEGNAPVDESELKYDLFTLDPSDKKIVAHYITSDEGLNNPTAVSADMEFSFRDALAAEEDYLFISGNGQGKPRGILNSPGLLKVDRDTSSYFKFADVLTMFKSHYPRANNKVWEISLDLYDQVAGMVDGSNRLIMVAGDASKGIPDVLHGRPIHWSEVNPAAGSLGDVILADWSFYYIKDGSGPFFAADPFTRFLEGEVRVKMTVKMDADTWIKQPLKLRNNMTVSPFVALKA